MKFTLSKDDKYRTSVRIGYRLDLNRTSTAVYEYLSTYGPPPGGIMAMTKADVEKAVRQSLFIYGASLFDERGVVHSDNHYAPAWDGLDLNQVYEVIENRLCELYPELA